jgi:hypothetical protein
VATDSPSERFKKALEILQRLVQALCRSVRHLQSTVEDLAQSLSIALQDTRELLDRLGNVEGLVVDICDAAITTDCDFVVTTRNLNVILPRGSMSERGKVFDRKKFPVGQGGD